MSNPRQLVVTILLLMIAFGIGNFLVTLWGENSRWLIFIAVFIYYVIWYQRYRKR